MSEDDKNNEWVISYRQIGLILLVFILGLISALLITNAQTGSPSAFTTTELISFVLSVILSGSSIVLAVTAITLGKSSEQAVIKRSDESIRLQNEVFIKTTEALQRIEASTGVTEKRIEDIISGRVGDISHQIAEMATKGGSRRSRDPKALEEDIRRSLIKTIKREESDEDIAERKRNRKEQKEKEEEYQKSHERILYSIANKNDIDVEKIGHGTIPGEGEYLFDGIFKKAEERIGVSTFRPDSSAEMFIEFISSAASELSKGTVNKIIMILFERNGDDEIFGDIKSQLALLKDEISSNISIKNTDYENIETWAKEIKL